MRQTDGGPAFPHANAPPTGMSLRDWFAGQALAGLLGRDRVAAEGEKLPTLRKALQPAPFYGAESYRLADAMLAARERGDE